jgi:hypothetical protein
VSIKHRIISTWLIIVWGVLLPSAVGGTSLYSLNFIGERLESGDTRAIALGGVTQLIPDSLGVLQLNPALLTHVRRVTIGATQLLALDEGRSADYTERDISVAFPVFRVAFPIARRLVISIGYTGRFDADGTLGITGVSSGGDAYTQTFKKSGGLFSIPATASIALTRFASVGLTLSMERGFIEERWDIVFDDRSFAPGAGLKKEEVSGTGFGGGLVLTWGKLLVGGMYESAIDYDADIRERFTESGLDTSYQESVTLPERVSVGATLKVTPDVMLLGSASWSNFEDFEGMAFPMDRLGTERSYAIGLEYSKGLPVKGRRLPIRLSFNYQELPYEQPLGKTVNKVLFGLGTGLLFGGGRGKIDLALQAGKIGSINDNLLEDRIFRIYLGVSGSEAWKRKRERDY